MADHSRAGSIRLRLLNNAEEGSLLVHLTLPAFAAQRGETIQIEPPLSVDDARAELETLLRDGRVELYAGDATTPLTLEGALAAIADEESWVPGSESFSLDITDSGLEEYHRDYPPSLDSTSY